MDEPSQATAAMDGADSDGMPSLLGQTEISLKPCTKANLFLLGVCLQCYKCNEYTCLLSHSIFYFIKYDIS